MIQALSFDVGGVLVELDTGMLSARLAERGQAIEAAALDAAWPAAWRTHEARVAAGARHPWRELMTALLVEAGAREVPPLVDWLWDEQQRRNLWRRQVAGMRALVERLHAAGVPMVVVSNSEGKLAALLDELGWSRWFVAIADSGALGVAKPDPEIFAWAARRLGAAPGSIAHVGDSREADVEGALGAGWRAIWFGPTARPLDQPRTAACADAAALRDLLSAWGLPA